MPDERAAFLAYRSRPTPDALVDLLRAHQERVFRLAYQILRNVHDAEDAAQGALIKIAADARRFSDADAFRRWLYRVSLNAALEVARKSARRRLHESRAAMAKPQPLDDATRLSIFEAISSLDDAARDLILEHHFEGETLEALGRREQISAPAMHKRLEAARESLRRRLGSALVLVPLESLFVPAPASPDLVTAIAGGAAVTTKTLLVPIALAALLAMGTAAGVALLIHERTPRVDYVAGTGPPAVLETTRSPMESAAMGGHTVLVTEEAKETPSSLQTRLESFRKWWTSIEAGREAARVNHDVFTAWRDHRDKEHLEQVAGLKDLIRQDPKVFVDFLKDPANEAMIGDLTFPNVLTHIGKDPKVQIHQTGPISDLPPELTAGLLEFFQVGSPRQRVAAFNLMDGLKGIPEEFTTLFLALIDDPDSEVQGRAISQVSYTLPMTPAIFAKLAGLGTSSESLTVRLRVSSVMARTPGSEADVFLLNRLASLTNQNELFNLAYGLEYRYRDVRASGNSLPEDHLAKAISTVISRGEDIRHYHLVHIATYLPGDRLKPLLMQMMGTTKDDSWRGRLEKAVQMIDAGNARRDELLKVLEPW